MNFRPGPPRLWDWILPLSTIQLHPSMDKNPVVLWSSGPAECVVIHHWDTQSYEIQVLCDGRRVERRWFVTSEEAAAFAAGYRDKLAIATA